MVGEFLRGALLAGLLALPAMHAGAAAGGASAAPPVRVVSMNLCTDQLAMLLAAPGQLVSISALARDPLSSAMTKEAANYPVNNGLAEEIYLLKPDLVLAGTYTGRATVAMLKRLGIPVVEFDPAYSLADVRKGMIGVGAALGRPEAAAAMVAEFDRGLAELAPPPASQRPTAAIYDANGYASGRDSLQAEVIEAAGLHYLAGDLGMPEGGNLPLELLVMADPDLVISGERYPGNSRSEEILDHPALRALGGGRSMVADRDWVCGLPSVIDAIARLAGERLRIEAAQ